MSNDTQVHPNFNAADADISILSSDGVLFRIHSINLKVNSTAFPTEITSNPNDPATFSEPSSILELLFAFLYPSPSHPTLTDLSFDILQPLAYAAHKYGIASAISLCNVMMIESAKSRDDEHPLELLEYVCRYMLDEDKRVEAAAIITLSSQTVRALEILDINVFAAWACLTHSPPLSP